MFRSHRIYASLLPTRVASLLLAVFALVVAGCSLQSAVPAAGTVTPTRPAFAPGGIYVNPALEFSLTVPVNWIVDQRYGVRQLPHTAAVTLVYEKRPADQISVNVTEGDAAVEAFAARGTAPAHVGVYPA